MQALDSSRIAAMLRKASPIEMDLYARARILESAAGMPKWSLSKNPRMFLREGPAQFPDVDPLWFSNRDEGLAAAVLGGAKKVLKAQTGLATAEEVAQNMASGMTVSGAGRSDIYGDVGKHKGPDILIGRVSPAQIRTTLWALAQRRAIDVWRSNSRRQEVLPDPESGAGAGSTTSVADTSPLEVVLHLVTSEHGREFRNWIYRILQRASPSQRIVMELSFNYLAAHQKWPRPQDILEDYVAATGGKPVVPRAVSLMRDKAIRFIKEQIDSSPQVLDWMDRYLDLASLGYGGGQLRLAKMARRVADRFLTTPI